MPVSIPKFTVLQNALQNEADNIHSISQEMLICLAHLFPREALRTCIFLIRVRNSVVVE